MKSTLQNSSRTTPTAAAPCPRVLRRRAQMLLPAPFVHPSAAPATIPCLLPRTSAFDAVFELADAARPAANEAIQANAFTPQAITTYILAIGFLAILVALFLIPLGGFFGSKGK